MTLFPEWIYIKNKIPLVSNIFWRWQFCFPKTSLTTFWKHGSGNFWEWEHPQILDTLRVGTWLIKPAVPVHSVSIVLNFYNFRTLFGLTAIFKTTQKTTRNLISRQRCHFVDLIHAVHIRSRKISLFLVKFFLSFFIRLNFIKTVFLKTRFLLIL